jgi:Tfp pilus assembly protein PilX
MKRIVSYHENGAALIIALIMLLVLTVVGIMALDASRHEVNIVGNQRIYNSAFYAAESGFDEFRSNPPWNNPSDSIPFCGSRTIGSAGNAYRYKSDRIGSRNDGGIPYHVFKITTEGTAPNFPNAGRVNLEAVIEVAAGGTGEGGAVDEIGKYN